MFLRKCAVFVLTLCALTIDATEATAPNYYPAVLCNTCGFGNKAHNCVKCGKWCGSISYQARLCNNCGFGTKKDACVKCGKWVGGTRYEAKLCNNCGFGNRQEYCVKCGKWVN